LSAIERFIVGLPKAELHVHIEGTLEPELMFALAQKNGVALPYASVDAVRAAYNFRNLQDFLDLYFQGMSVLCHEEDFYELTTAYLDRARRQGVVHAEIFFNPQAHVARGVGFDIVVRGIRRALEQAEAEAGLSSRLILGLLRDRDQDDALRTLGAAQSYKRWITGIGLDSAEVGHPPSKFKEAFARARALGFRVMAHAGEEGPPAYVWEALDILKVDRVDHGNRALEDPALVRRLAQARIALTVCPLSNVRLAVVRDIGAHPLRRMIEQNLVVTVNSDDPAYFGGYIADNYLAVQKALGLSAAEITAIARASIEHSFLERGDKARLSAALDAYVADAKPAF
jgi:adenosine deaminase